MEKVLSGAVAVVGLLAVSCAIGFLTAYPLMYLWNVALVPAIAGLHTVGWLQMWGINILVSCLFTSYSSTK